MVKLKSIIDERSAAAGNMQHLKLVNQAGYTAFVEYKILAGADADASLLFVRKLFSTTRSTDVILKQP